MQDDMLSKLKTEYENWRISNNIADLTPTIFKTPALLQMAPKTRKKTGSYRQSASSSSGKFRVLGTGSSGCAISPANLCSSADQSDNNLVAKYLSFTNIEKEELKAYQLISMADPEHEFTIRIKETCELNDDDVKISQEYCGRYFNTSLQKTMVSKKNRPHKIIMEYAGRPIVMIQQRPTFNEDFRELLNTLLPVFKGLVRLQQNGIAHADIKPENITVSELTRQAKLIDYGLTTSFKDLITNNVYETPYRYWPPEWRLLMGEKGLEDDRADEIARSLERKYDLNATDMFADPDFRQLQEKIISFYNTKLTSGPNRIVPGIFIDDSIARMFAYYYVFSREVFKLDNGGKNLGNQILDTWDIFGLGFTIYTLVTKSLFGGLVSLENLPMECQTLIYGMVNPNPFHRMVPEQVLTWVMEYISSKL